MSINLCQYCVLTHHQVSSAPIATERKTRSCCCSPTLMLVRMHRSHTCKHRQMVNLHVHGIRTHAHVQHCNCNSIAIALYMPHVYIIIVSLPHTVAAARATKRTELPPFHVMCMYMCMIILFTFDMCTYACTSQILIVVNQRQCAHADVRRVCQHRSPAAHPNQFHLIKRFRACAHTHPPATACAPPHMVYHGR